MDKKQKYVDTSDTSDKEVHTDIAMGTCTTNENKIVHVQVGYSILKKALVNDADPEVCLFEKEHSTFYIFEDKAAVWFSEYDDKFDLAVEMEKRNGTDPDMVLEVKDVHPNKIAEKLISKYKKVRRCIGSMLAPTDHNTEDLLLYVLFERVCYRCTLFGKDGYETAVLKKARPLSDYILVRTGMKEGRHAWLLTCGESSIMEVRRWIKNVELIDVTGVYSVVFDYPLLFIEWVDKKKEITTGVYGPGKGETNGSSSTSTGKED